MMVAPGVAVAPPSDLVTDRSGAAVTGVASVPVLFPGVGSGPPAPSSAMVTVLATDATPAGNGASTVTANVAVPVPPPPATGPTANVQVPAAHTQPAVEAPALNVPLAGTVSVSTTPVADCVPEFVYVSV